MTVLTVDDEGKLTVKGKARGKKGVVEELLKRFDELAFDPENSTFVISHADCMEDALFMKEKIMEKTGIEISEKGITLEGLCDSCKNKI